MAQLGGGAFIYGHGTPKIRWPDPNQAWAMPQTGHIDGYGLPLMLGATAYRYDVEARGGAFTYWPDSHHTAHRYFLEHPSHLDGSFLHAEGFTWDASVTILPRAARSLQQKPEICSSGMLFSSTTDLST